MDAFADKLGRIGAWCGQNKYLTAVKNAFQNFMPATIAGAIGVLWTNVLINDKIVNGAPQGLGGILPIVMKLEPLNVIFSAIQFATISCISIGIVMLVAQEIGEMNGEKGVFSAVLGFISWMVVTPNSYGITGQTVTLSDATTKTIADFLPKGATVAEFGGISSNYTGATGLFTALIIGILALEIFGMLRKMEGLKIKMPEQVPPGVAQAFEVLIPAFITVVIVGGIGFVIKTFTGSYVNDLIYDLVQEPLGRVIGNNLLAVLLLFVIISLFWLVGIHGNNMVGAVNESIFRPLLYANTLAYTSPTYRGQQDIPNILNLTMLEMFGKWGGSGLTLGLVIAIFLFGKREDNRAIASLSIVPGLFNINETVTFGLPIVLNPIIGIPFILAPCLSLTIGYFLTVVGFCPKVVLEVPWTMPPVLMGFLATGGNVMGAISQLIAIVAVTILYIPFLMAYEKYQNKQVTSLD
ncbi:MAG: PTS sugar transporter subunit IIC [Longibaculum sp.]